MVNRRPSAGNLFLGQPSTDRSAFRSFPSNEFSFVDLSIDTQQGQLAAKHRSSRFSSGVHDFLSRPRSLNTVGNVRIVSTDAHSSNLWKSTNHRVTCFTMVRRPNTTAKHPEGETRVRKTVSGDPGDRIEDQRGDSRNGKTGAEASGARKRGEKRRESKETTEKRRRKEIGHREEKKNGIVGSSFLRMMKWPSCYP